MILPFAADTRSSLRFIAAISGISPRLLDDVLADISEFSDMVFFCTVLVVQLIKLFFLVFWSEFDERVVALNRERETSLFCLFF